MLDELFDIAFDGDVIGHRSLQFMIFVLLLFAGWKLSFDQAEAFGLWIAAVVTNVVLFICPVAGWWALLAAIPPLGLGAAFVALNV